MKQQSPEIELSNIVLSWDLRTDLGMKAHCLAREILKIKDPTEEALKGMLIAQILDMESEMPRLEDLKKSLLNLTPDELRARIKTIREDRIIRKGPTPKAKAVKAEKKSKVKSDLEALLAGMTEEEVAKFLEELG